MKAARIILREVVSLLLGVWFSVSLVFALVRMLPGDPVRLMLGEQASAASLDGMRQALGLNKTMLAQYWDVLAGIPRGDFGASLRSARPVADLVLEALPYTLLLTVLTLLCTAAISLLLGTIAAYYRGKWLDRLTAVQATLGLSIPNFWLGPLLILLFSIQLHWFPTSFDGTWRAWVLPVLTLGTSLSALLTRVVRAGVLEVQVQPFVQASVARGTPPLAVFAHHILPNTMIPIVTILGLQAGALMAGSVVTEVIFSMPGLGNLMIDAILQRDYRLVEGCTMWVAFVYLALNRSLDLGYRLLDPRLRT